MNLQPFEAFQKLNQLIYGEQNRRVYKRTLDLIIKAMIYSGKAHKCARQGKFEEVSHYLCLSFSWCMAAANRLQIDLDKEVWEHFPDVCPYCRNKPCNPNLHSGVRHLLMDLSVKNEKPVSLQGYQQMFAGIYPHNTLSDSAGHLMEEMAEVIEMIQAIDHKRPRFACATLELVDGIANIMAVSNCTNVNLENCMSEMFKYGCHRCHKVPCKCGFTTTENAE